MIAVLTPLDQSKYLLMQADVEMADIDTSPDHQDGANATVCRREDTCRDTD